MNQPTDLARLRSQRSARMMIKTGLLAVLQSLLRHLALGSPVTSAASAPTVDLGYAQYQGAVDTTTNTTSFLGIRYAPVPVDNLRWASTTAPQPPSTLSGVQQTIERPNECYQAPTGNASTNPFITSLIGKHAVSESEDCLFVKSDSLIEIRTFGGDPSKVTIWGQSAGAGSILQHFVSHGSNTQPTLFRTAIASSTFLPSTYNYKDRISESWLKFRHPVLPSYYRRQHSTNYYNEVLLSVTIEHEGNDFIGQSLTMDISDYVSAVFPDIQPWQAALATPLYRGLITNVDQANYAMPQCRVQIMLVLNMPSFICLTYYLLEAFSSRAWKGEFAIPPAPHSNDLSYLHIVHTRYTPTWNSWEVGHTEMMFNKAETGAPNVLTYPTDNSLLERCLVLKGDLSLSTSPYQRLRSESRAPGTITIGRGRLGRCRDDLKALQKSMMPASAMVSQAALEVGTFLSCAAFGCSIVQAYKYYENVRNDHWILRALSYFIYRIHKISGSVPFTLFCFSLTLVRVSMNVSIGIASLSSTSIFALEQQWNHIITSLLAFAMGSDLIVAAGLCYNLKKHGKVAYKGFSFRSRVLFVPGINLNHTPEIGLLTSSTELLELMLTPGLVSTPFHVPAIHVNSLLAALNRRTDLRKEMPQVHLVQPENPADRSFSNPGSLVDESLLIT
ncbi:hypothetical protein HYDPIDRAFT_169905 [Hydnomerulius pinastri MD-312]|uniref:Carboxylic ester hydrolase n=1 Tax=Hydnomerulius pinastri MD-312 TaxID=994086 RepID=A0A0C9WB93_9AGAM|nr:hypothetical protein HYDPIDRAFT_169905 [Hydnomerulius pinastri MD-312]